MRALNEEVLLLRLRSYDLPCALLFSVGLIDPFKPSPDGCPTFLVGQDVEAIGNNGIHNLRGNVLYGQDPTGEILVIFSLVKHGW